MSSLRLVIGLSIAGLVIGAVFSVLRFNQEPDPDPLLYQLELPDIDKQLRSGSEWRGEIVIANHWATWCGPCREEIPMLIDYQQRHADRGIQVVGIAHDLLDAARSFGDQIGINYPSLVAITGSAELLVAHGNGLAGALPYTVIFDRQGRVAASHLGLLDAKKLTALVEPLLSTGTAGN